MIDKDQIARNAGVVTQTVADAARMAGRAPREVTIVAVSKTMPIECVEAAYIAGMRHFGENRVQEAEGKIGKVVLEGVSWHLIGHLQTNKARTATRIFDVIQSVDSIRVAESLSREAIRLDRQLDVLLEVNISGEQSKFGMSTIETPDLAARIAGLNHLRLIGLMTIAPFVEDPEEARPFFREMRLLSDQVRTIVGHPELWHLSMGMSNDYSVAIDEGATIVRIGRAIFGERA